MDERPSACSAEHSETSFSTDDMNESCFSVGSGEELDGPEQAENSNSKAEADEATIDEDTRVIKSNSKDEDRENSDVVRQLDEELAELEKLVALQQRKVDALQRLRRQWISGERYTEE